MIINKESVYFFDKALVAMCLSMHFKAQSVQPRLILHKKL